MESHAESAFDVWHKIALNNEKKGKMKSCTTHAQRSFTRWKQLWQKIVVYFSRCVLWAAGMQCTGVESTKRYSNWVAFTWLWSVQVEFHSCGSVNVLGAHEPHSHTHGHQNIQSKSDFNWKENILRMLNVDIWCEQTEFIKFEIGYARVCVCVRGNDSWPLHVSLPSAGARFVKMQNYIFVDGQHGNEVNWTSGCSSRNHEIKCRMKIEFCSLERPQFRLVKHHESQHDASETQWGMKESNQHASMNDINYNLERAAHFSQ